MLGAIRRMRVESGISVLLVEQKHDLALEQGGWCAVIDHGSVVHTGPSEELLHDHEQLDRLLGVAA
jgi:branched-chain amino acid transport system ATP-binding protein